MGHKEKLTEILYQVLQDNGNMASELAELLYNNGAIVLPCKVGDIVYKVWYTECHNGETSPMSYGCCGCEDECDIDLTITPIVASSVRWIVDNFMSGVELGIYFLDRDEAEAQLERFKKIGRVEF